jgi:DNA-binding transcriptional LysR family regulator
MELRHLRYFTVAAEEQNFRRAADRLHITQSSLSRRIRDLETEIGAALFERHQQRVRLTAAGRAFLEDASLVLRQLEGTMARARRIANGEIGALSIALHYSMARHPIVARSIQRFRAQRKDVLLKIEPMLAAAMPDALRTGSVDAAFLYSRPVDDPAFEALKVGSGEMVLALPRSHRLASKTQLRLTDLKDEDFLWMARDSSPAVHDKLMAACQAGGLNPRIVQYLGSENVRTALVGVGMGLTFVVSTYRPAAGEDVVTRRVAGLSFPLELELVWVKRTRSVFLEQFAKVVEASVAEHKKGAPRSKQAAATPRAA